MLMKWSALHQHVQLGSRTLASGFCAERRYHEVLGFCSVGGGGCLTGDVFRLRGLFSAIGVMDAVTPPWGVCSRVAGVVVVCTLGWDVTTYRYVVPPLLVPPWHQKLVGGVVVPTLHARLVLAIVLSLPSSSTLGKIPTWHGCVIDKSMVG
uniref:Uncharacterized protein n=1 Tax=Cannabis sativa TaxID=3483 RepID=A0A803QB75_CANSA